MQGNATTRWVAAEAAGAAAHNGATFHRRGSVPIVKVIGVGGCGDKVVQRMVSEGVAGIEFIAADTDRPAFPTRIDDEAVVLAAQEEKIQHAVSDADTVLIVAGMGGGTGARAATAVAKAARRMGRFTLAVVTKPFLFEGRQEAAEHGVAKLSQEVHSLIAIPNHKLPAISGDASRKELFAAAENTLCGVVRDLAYAIIRPGAIHDGLADVRTVIPGSLRVLATVGVGDAAGGNRARLAADAAMRSPLLDHGDLRRAGRVLVNVATAGNLGVRERHVVIAAIREAAAQDSTIVVGIVDDLSMDESMRVTVVATGFGMQPRRVAEAGDS